MTKEEFLCFGIIKTILVLKNGWVALIWIKKNKLQLTEVKLHCLFLKYLKRGCRVWSNWFVAGDKTVFGQTSVFIFFPTEINTMQIREQMIPQRFTFWAFYCLHVTLQPKICQRHFFILVVIFLLVWTAVCGHFYKVCMAWVSKSSVQWIRCRSRGGGGGGRENSSSPIRLKSMQNSTF